MYYTVIILTCVSQMLVQNRLEKQYQSLKELYQENLQLEYQIVEQLEYQDNLLKLLLVLQYLPESAQNPRIEILHFEGAVSDIPFEVFPAQESVPDKTVPLDLVVN